MTDTSTVENGDLQMSAISVVIIVRDAVKTLADTLASLNAFQEVIVYDNGSTDGSVAIAQQFENVTLVKGQFLGYGETKNYAASFASHNLILSLDADEVLTPELVQEIAQLQAQWQPHWVGSVPRLNFFLGKPIWFGDWRNDRVLRLYDRRHHQFCHRSVHESLSVNREMTVVKRLRHRLFHHTVETLSQSLQKMDRYSELYAQEKMALGEQGLHPWLCFLKAQFAFFRCYLLRGGCLDGWRGLLLAYGVSVGVFYKYVKVRVAHQIGAMQLSGAAVGLSHSLSEHSLKEALNEVTTVDSPINDALMIHQRSNPPLTAALVAQVKPERASQKIGTP